MYYYIMYWNSVAYFRWGEISDGGDHICNVKFMKKKTSKKRWEKVEENKNNIQKEI